MSINPVQACQGRANALAAAEAAIAAQRRRIQQAHRELVEDLNTILDLDDVVFDQDAIDLINEFMNSPVNEFFLTPQNVIDFLSLLGDLISGSFEAGLAAIQIPFDFRELDHQVDLLGDFEQARDEARLDYLNCISSVMHP